MMIHCTSLEKLKKDTKESSYLIQHLHCVLCSNFPSTTIPVTTNSKCSFHLGFYFFIRRLLLEPEVAISSLFSTTSKLIGVLLWSSPKSSLSSFKRRLKLRPMIEASLFYQRLGLHVSTLFGFWWFNFLFLYYSNWIKTWFYFVIWMLSCHLMQNFFFFRKNKIILKIDK